MANIPGVCRPPAGFHGWPDLAVKRVRKFSPAYFAQPNQPAGTYPALSLNPRKPFRPSSDHTAIEGGKEEKICRRFPPISAITRSHPLWYWRQEKGRKKVARPKNHGPYGTCPRSGVPMCRSARQAEACRDLEAAPRLFARSSPGRDRQDLVRSAFAPGGRHTLLFACSKRKVGMPQSLLVRFIHCLPLPDVRKPHPRGRRPPLRWSASLHWARWFRCLRHRRPNPAGNEGELKKPRRSPPARMSQTKIYDRPAGHALPSHGLSPHLIAKGPGRSRLWATSSSISTST